MNHLRNVWFGNVEKALSSELARIAAEREGLSEELDGARATLARIAGEQDRLVNEGSSLWNDVVEITGELARVASEHDDAAREIVDPLIPGHGQTIPRSVSFTRQHHLNVARESSWLS